MSSSRGTRAVFGWSSVVVLVLVSFVGTGCAQSGLAKLPACALSCATTAASNVGCSLNDATCTCGSGGFVTDTLVCSAQGCNLNDQSTSVGILKSVCDVEHLPNSSSSSQASLSTLSNVFPGNPKPTTSSSLSGSHTSSNSTHSSTSTHESTSSSTDSKSHSTSESSGTSHQTTTNTDLSSKPSSSTSTGSRSTTLVLQTSTVAPVPTGGTTVSSGGVVGLDGRVVLLGVLVVGVLALV
ncbi:hypothetical protein BDN72DRAFT_641347 [Pluteus cervinus]|uniref:Uncharacterized protein n=1 Tax=Pluteus cervinus TaxID=181527 RepID=A0ACD3AT85_9AGAR|nr:hypothetical protein BDN72DRAFT_641347 [Pluteus cervinus]